MASTTAAMASLVAAEAVSSSSSAAWVASVTVCVTLGPFGTQGESLTRFAGLAARRGPCLRVVGGP